MPKTTKKQPTNFFGKWISNIPSGEYKNIRDSIINECKITRQTLNNWKNGKCRVPPLAQEKITQIAGKRIFVVRTNKKTKKL